MKYVYSSLQFALLFLYWVWFNLSCQVWYNYCGYTTVINWGYDSQHIVVDADGSSAFDDSYSFFGHIYHILGN